MPSIQEVDGWPDLPYAAWKETCETLHLWTQVVGKIRLAQTPWLNHSWHVALYLTARGLTTSPIPYAACSAAWRAASWLGNVSEKTPSAR